MTKPYSPFGPFASPQKKAKPYRLKIGLDGRKRDHVATLKEARADARFYLSAGTMKVCIEKRLPSGDYKQVACMTRRKRKAK